jgi:hypothetical protein
MHGTVIKPQRTVAIEGQAKPPGATVLIPVVGQLTLFKRGTDAVIARGTPLDATVDTDSVLVASKQHPLKPRPRGFTGDSYRKFDGNNSKIDCTLVLHRINWRLK